MRLSKTINLAQPNIGSKEIRAVTKVLKSGNLAQGVKVSNFEKAFSKHVEDRHCIAVNSGTSALVTALMALGLGVGDEVIVPSFTFAATANAVSLVGAVPVFVDINLKTYNIEPEQIVKSITKKTRAIQVVHLYGLPADMRKILEIAKKYNLLVIEDAAQAHLAKIDGKPVGTFGDAAAFSFYPTKNMTSAEGGMVVFSDERLARTARLLRNQGMEKRYENEIPGFNFRMSEIHAAIGIEQLKKLEKWTLCRQQNASFYNENLESVITPDVPIGFEHVYHQYTLFVPVHRDRLASELNKSKIGNAVYYPTQVHKLPSFNRNTSLPNTFAATQSVLSIPVHPKLKNADLKRISSKINEIMNLL
jgi:dTDP-4-amino-4,6-dideoxygalactose transaminase